MTTDDFIRRAKKAVRDSYNAKAKRNGGGQIGTANVWLVWLCKTLQNQKALLITDTFDGKYYEFTYNGDKKESYLDTYVKESNEVLL